MHDDWMNEDEIEAAPLTGWDKFWLAVLGLITVLSVALYVKIGGWIVWWIKGVFA